MIVGRTRRVGRCWHAEAWVVGDKAGTHRVDPIGFRDRARARRRVARVRNAVEMWS